MMNPAEYTIAVRFGCFDEESCFEAIVRELPDVAEYGDTADEAYELAIDTIQTTSEIFAEKGKDMPAPAPAQSDFSGRVTLRIAKSLHQVLSLQAEDECVSLNQHIVNVLTYSAGYIRGHSRDEKEVWSSFDASMIELESTGTSPTVREVPLRCVA